MKQRNEETEQAEEWTPADRRWYVLTRSAEILVAILIYMFWLAIGYHLESLLHSDWNGSLPATYGIMLGLLFWVAISEVARWAVVDGLEWVLAVIEVNHARPPGLADETSPAE